MKPWLAALIARVLACAALGAEYTTLELSDSAVRPVYADHQNLKVQQACCCHLSSRPDGRDLWLDIANGPVEERVDGKGNRWLGTAHELHKGKPFVLDPKRAQEPSLRFSLDSSSTCACPSSCET